MASWETDDHEQPFDDAEREFAERKKAMPMAVFSTTLTAVEGTNMRFATAGLTDEFASHAPPIGPDHPRRQLGPPHAPSNQRSVVHATDSRGMRNPGNGNHPGRP